MKKNVLFSLFIFCYLYSFEQEKAMLTKEETLNFIKKKLNEVKGNPYPVPGDGYYHYRADFILIDQEAIYTFYTGKSPVEEGTDIVRKTIVKFRPDLVSESSFNFGPTLPADPTGRTAVLSFKCQFASRIDSATRIHNGKFYSQGGSPDPQVWMYLFNLPENKNKMIKALQHLKALLKAEDDPFEE